jgi:hypothetical protein
MNTVQEIISMFNKLPNRKRLKSTEIGCIKDSLEMVKEFSNKTETKTIDSVLKIISKGTLTDDDRESLKRFQPKIVAVVKKYEEYYEDEPNDDEINDDFDTDQVEELLDKKISDYNKYDKNHPMMGVTWDDKRKLWRLHTKDVNTYHKNFNNVVQQAKDLICAKITNEIYQNGTKKHFSYHNHYFVSYGHDNKPYFDILHIISLLNLKKGSQNDKYREFSKDITFCLWHKNKFGGYILRELITKKTMFNLILSSNSDFSKSFKSDVSKILSDLWDNGELEITNVKINRISKKNQNSGTPVFDHTIKPRYRPFKYTTPDNYYYVQSLVSHGSRFPIAKFLGRHVLYAVILAIKNENEFFIINEVSLSLL